jgi:hypothetical protein
MARTIAIAATGEVPAGLACQFAVSRSQLRPPSPEHALTEAFGPSTLDVPVASARGWTIASWLVGHAQEYRITSVRYAGRQWTPDGAWNAFRATDAGVGITQATPT